MGSEERSRFYDALATSIEAGLPLPQAVTVCAPARSGVMEAAARQVAAGKPLSAALPAPELETRILEAGEGSGRLVDALRRLAARRAREMAFRRRLLLKLAYPVALLHAAVLLPTLPRLVSQGLASYLSSTLPLLLGLYVGAALLFIAWRLLPAEAVMTWPVIGTYLRSRAVAVYAFVLASLVSAGLPLVSALETAARCLELAPLRRAAWRVAAAVRSGRSLGEAMERESESFGPLAAQFIAVGEHSGTLESAYEKLEEAADDDAGRASWLIAVIAGVLAMVVAAGMIAGVVIDFWSGYAAQIESIG